ncbi:Translation initiation factor eIF-2B subunit epsilon [Rhynchospora pubera]|uniref:Translation initiation factor eIF2B subunit epsilon n=1 Tax=Rhynchospora pubera TaxID=906938 RepID=A0AAV8EKK5_9POAL|nr:Translation initiation factor eIF-2B subunit epsilon [Rhynchospora pubera]
MAQKKGGKSAASDDPEELARMPLQAVLLADTFNLKFRPITLERPKVLLPLVNTPMIDYTLAWLVSVGVEEVFLFCCAHAEQVKEYIGNSHWGQSHAGFSITTIESNFSMSAGDALRFIEGKNVIRGDFILITGDTISNMSLTEALQAHKDRRKKDPDTVMTMFVKRSKPMPLTHQTRLGNDEIMMAIDPETKQLLYYEDRFDSSKRAVTLDKSLLADNASLYLRTDLEDCCIDICSPEVLTIFLDNFDYQHLRRHFVKGLLHDDIMGKKIYTHEIDSSYTARVDNYRSYDTISKDIIQRWSFPLVPDVLYAGNRAQMRLQREGIYKAPDVTLSPSVRIGAFTAIGSGTIIGENSSVSNSVIGELCTIGRNVSIDGCYIWDSVTIEDGCRLSHSIVCDGVHLHTGATLEPGVILSFKVEVGQNITVPAYSKVSLLPQPSKQDSDEELEYADTNSGVIDSPSIASISPANIEHDHVSSFDTEQSVLLEGGLSGVGYIWTSCETGNEEEWRYSVAPIPVEKLKEFYAKMFDEDESSSDGEQTGITHSGELISESKSTDFDDSDGEYKGDVSKFEKEVEETFERALGGVAEENVQLEINSLRMSFNVTHAECAGAVFQSVIKSAIIASNSSKSNLLKATIDAIERSKGLLSYFITNVDEEIEVILKFEEMCMEITREFAPIFSSVLHQLYDKEVITEDAILKWESEKADADESDKVFVKQSEAFLKWLKEAPEEDDEDE